MPSSGVLRRVALVRTDVSEELSASFIRVTRIGEVRTMLAVTSNRSTLPRNNVPSSPILVTLMKKVLSTSETSFLTSATRRTLPEDALIHSHHSENLKSYVTYIVHSSQILLPQLMEGIRSSKTSIVTKATLHNIPIDGIVRKRFELQPGFEMNFLDLYVSILKYLVISLSMV
jgi:hypothetical protein